jgi:hypothetical protein
VFFYCKNGKNGIEEKGEEKLCQEINFKGWYLPSLQ